MDINSTTTFNTNFGNVNPKILKKIDKIRPEYRKSIVENYNVLADSNVLDLTLNKEGSIVLRTKKTLKNIIEGNKDLPADTMLKLSCNTNSSVKGSKLIISDVNIRANDTDIFNDDKYKDLVIDLGTPKYAKKAKVKVEFTGKSYHDKLPFVGAFIDAAYKISEPLETIRKVMSQTING